MSRIEPDRTRPPAPGALRPFHLPEVAELKLSSGLPLRFIPDRRVPLVTGVLVVASGEAALLDGVSGTAGVGGEALMGGTERRSGAELAEALEARGTAFRITTGWEAMTLSFTCTAERLDNTLELLAEVLLTPIFPEDEVSRIREQRLAALAQRRADPSDLADDESDRVLYPEGHPRRRGILGEEAALTAVSRERVAGWATSALRPEGGGLVLAGDLDPVEALARAESHLGGWTGAPLPLLTLPPVQVGPQRRVVVRHRPGAVQSELRLLHPGPPRNTPDFAALSVGNAILGGSFTSRLNLNLRERHGFTYGIRSGWTFRRRDGEFSISTAVGTEVTVAALEQMLRELEGYLKEGPTEEETARTRDYVVGIFPLRMETASQLAARTAELITLGLPSDTHHRFRDEIRGVTRDGAHAAMARHLDGALAPIVLVADADAVVPGIEALGLGPVEVL
jgi:zinc protease